MNPAVLNYLQTQQQPNQNMGQEPQQQAPYNPFDSGISKAVLSARESLGMTDKQQDKALRRSMAAFGNNISQQPKQKGFWNNFGSIGRALSPAIQEYDNAEDAALTQNNAIANQILAHQAAEDRRLGQDEEKAWRRGMAEKQHAEQVRYHDMSNSRASGNSGNNDGLVNIEGRSFRPLDKMEQRQANKFKKSAGNTYLAVKEINKSWDKLGELTKNNSFQPIGGYSGLANPVKDFFGKYSNNKDLQKETAARKDLAAKMGNLTAVLEAIKAGGGKLGQGMYDRLKPNFPDMKNDDLETMKEKMSSITKEMDTYYKAAQLSSDLGIAIDANDIDEMEMANLQNTAGKEDQNSILMQDQNGEQYSIPRNEVEEAINHGFTPIGGK
jgi:hypothetical protein